MGRDVLRRQIREALQLHSGGPTIETDVRVAMAHADIAMTLQVGESLAFQVKCVVTGDKVGNDVAAAEPMAGNLEQVMPGAPYHRGVARAAHERVVAGSTLHDHIARTADKLGGVISSNQCRIARVSDLLVCERLRAAVRGRHTQELESSTFDGGAAERAIYRCMAGLGNRVVSVAQIDGVVPYHRTGVVLNDHARHAVYGELIATGTDRYVAAVIDGNRVVAIAGGYGTVPVDVDIGVATPGNAYKSSHLILPAFHGTNRVLRLATGAHSCC